MFQKISLEKKIKKNYFFAYSSSGHDLMKHDLSSSENKSRKANSQSSAPKCPFSFLHATRRSNADSFRKSFWATAQENHASPSHFRMLPVKNRALPSACDTDLVPNNQRMAKCDRPDHSNLEKSDGPVAWFLHQVVLSTSEITTNTEMSRPMSRGSMKMSCFAENPQDQIL